MLEKALITTIDAFCANVLKSNFQYLGDLDISMNYKNLDSTQFAVLSSEVLDEVLEAFYAEGDPSFTALMDLFTKGKNDLSISAVIDTLHRYTSSFADKQDWFAKQTQRFLAQSAGESAWGQLVLTVACEYLSLALDYCDKALAILAPDAKTDAVYGDFIRSERALIECAYTCAAAGAWDGLYSFKQSAFARYPGKSKDMDLELKARAKTFRDAAKDMFWEALKAVVEDEASFLEDNARIYPIALQLKTLFEAYEEKLFARKLELQSFEFSDISYLTLQILRDENHAPSEVALDYRKSFKGILVDEYQDTNGVQDAIFRLISDHNLFVVGDVKQSIYRFRQAMPEIFLRKRELLPPYVAGADKGTILLKNNFRSENPITDLVNFLFKRLMSRELGDVEYNEDEYLIPNLKKTGDDAPTPELHILDDVFSEEREDIKAAAFEAQYIAALIRKMVESGETLKIGEEERALGYSDFCVLVRAKTHLPRLKEALEKQSIPFSADNGENLFDTPEIMLVMSFLRAIDNPLRDVDLIAVLYSELFGFTAEELSLIRIAKRKGSFFAAVSALGAEGNSRCAAFVETLEQYRTWAATNEPAAFLEMLYEQSGITELVLASENGSQKRANLLKFISVVQLYADAGYYGLTGLVRFLEKVKDNSSDIATAYLPEGESKVKLMTVHASKGLEFPVVIFAFTNQSNNHYASNIVLNREYGFGIKPKDTEENIRFDTLSYAAVQLANLRNDIAEELRTLYVALTRAKSKLIITGTYAGKRGDDGETPAKTAISDIAKLTADAPDISKAWMRKHNNFLSWLIACALQHPTAAALRMATGESDFAIDTLQEGKLTVVLPEFYPEQTAPEAPVFSAQADAAMKAAILENFAYTYPYAGSELIESKMTPSALAEHAAFDLDFAFSAPAFIEGEKLGAAAKGTATHRFMEKASFGDSFDFDNETARMLEKGFLSAEQAEVLDRRAIEQFFESALFARMKHSERLEREYQVSYLEYAAFFDDSLPEKLHNEKVFVDGMLDAVFVENGEAVIVDYKTDKVKSAEALKTRYFKQMELYKRAIEAVWGIPVSCCHIWSFALGEDIVVEF